MPDSSCELFSTIQELSSLLISGTLTHPRCQQIAEDLLRLLKDLSFGTGGPDHLGSIESLARMLEKGAYGRACHEAGKRVLESLAGNREVFISHIETRNCPTGDCERLTPAPCQMACPAGIDVPGYVALIAMGRGAEAVELIRKDNPFPWVCGLVCTHPCELMCVRGRIDQPIAIKDIKTFAAEQAFAEGLYRNPEKAPDNGRRVCIIGAGPAGLTAAYYLALKGYGVTVVEALPYAGGMMMVGIPRYRLPREVIDREVAMIEDLGVEFRFQTRLGVDVTMEDLKREGFEVFFLAIGAHSAYRIRIPGEEDSPRVMDAIRFLRRVAKGDRQIPGRKVAVIGGGNVAIDAARTSLRLGSREVYILYRRSRSEMPAAEEEVLQAEQEGIRCSFLTVPVEIIHRDGKVEGIHCVRTELGPADESGRRRPLPVDGSDHVLEVDAVITAIGQAVDPVGLEAIDDLKWSHRETILARTASAETPSPGIFAGGDVVLGPATVVEAIGSGKKAAAAIDRYFEGLPQPKSPPVPVRRTRLHCREQPAYTKMFTTRPEMPLLHIERRKITFQQVELGLTEEKAREEAGRCLRCDICIRCGRCVEICREKMGIDALKLGYFDFDHPTSTDFTMTAERCILCGACATHCPTGAMKMEDRGRERVLTLCGTVLNRLELEYCEGCGAVLGPARYHDYISRRTNGISPVVRDRRLCIECARKSSAHPHAEITPPDTREKERG
jgi:NADPH-dependent glutamate synthase beta subunit-like oxidoreductase